MSGTAYLQHGSAKNLPMSTELVKARRSDPLRPYSRGKRCTPFLIKRDGSTHWVRVYEDGMYGPKYAMIGGQRVKVQLNGREVD